MPSRPPLHRPPGAKSAAAVKRELDQQRPSAARRGYGARWRRARAAYLARHPLCVPCEGAGRLEAATVVDHVVPHRHYGLLGRWAMTGMMFLTLFVAVALGWVWWLIDVVRMPGMVRAHNQRVAAEILRQLSPPRDPVPLAGV